MAEKIFLTKNAEAIVLCPECGKTKMMDFERFINTDREIKLKITCKCSHVFPVILERRRHVRKQVDFYGGLINGNKKYSIAVIDISRMGLKLRTKEVLDLNPDDKVVVEFILDDIGRSKVSKDVIIRKIDKEYIGAEFLSQSHYDKFGTYLLYDFG
jgi:hypothetical protein